MEATAVNVGLALSGRRISGSPSLSKAHKGVGDDSSSWGDMFFVACFVALVVGLSWFGERQRRRDQRRYRVAAVKNDFLVLCKIVVRTHAFVDADQLVLVPCSALCTHIPCSAL
jgi:hypothetical protein